MRRVALLGLTLLAVGIAGATEAGAAGPWRARVVDARSGAPLDDVVVVAFWVRLLPGPVHLVRTLHAADEAVSDAGGRVELPARRTWTWLPLSRIEGPQLRLFKAGYGQWRFAGADAWSGLDAVERRQRVDEAWRQLETAAGATIELAPALTRAERLRAVGAAEIFAEVPVERVPRWVVAYDREREALGLQPRPKTPGGTP